jgi:hypothetical protein
VQVCTLPCRALSSYHSDKPYLLASLHMPTYVSAFFYRNARNGQSEDVGHAANLAKHTPGEIRMQHHGN